MPTIDDLDDENVDENGDETGSDLDPRVRKYFEAMVAQGGRRASPEFQGQLTGSRMADADASIGRAQLGGMAEGLAKLGTLSGKSPDVKPLTTTLSGIDTAQRQRSAGMMADEDDAQKRQGMNAKVYEYLQSRTDKTRENEAARQARTDQAKATLQASNERHQSDQDLKRELAGQSMALRRDMADARADKPEKEPSGDQFKAAGFARRLEAAEEDFEDLTKAGFNRATPGQAIAGLPIFPEGMKSENTKRQDQAERNFVNAVLRRESGAAISPAEFQSAELQYFPRIGDTPTNLEQKRRNREQKKVELIAEGGRAYDKVPLAARRNVPAVGGSGTAIAAPGGGKAIKTRLFSPSRNKTKVVYTDGTEEVLDGQQ